MTTVGGFLNKKTSPKNRIISKTFKTAKRLFCSDKLRGGKFYRDHHRLTRYIYIYIDI